MLRIFYDGECPFCSRYVKMLRLSKSGQVQLVDLREDEAAKAELEELGFDLDQGMVVEDEGRRYGGSDAVAYLAPLSTPSDALNRINRAVFSKPSIARILYPLLRSGRWLVLFLMNRRMIEDRDDASLARREIFATFFALFSVFHFFNYAFEYQRFPPSWDLVMVLGAAVLMFFRPSSARVLFALMLVSTISTIVQAPVHSNHTMVRSAALLGYWLSFFIAMARNDSVSLIFERFAPAGCAALLVMYFFGIFHKINTDFLDPATSCAMALWQLMPRPFAMLEGPVIEHMAIYGTFIIEGAIVLALLIRRFRHVGIAVGIAFHLLLSLSGYAMYISFTMLALALHTLFLNEKAARAIIGAQFVLLIRRKLAEPIYKLLALSFILWLAAFAFIGNYTFASLGAFPLILPFCWAVLRYGGAPGAYIARWQTISVGMLVGVLFFLNCSLPYAGLKTAQTVNMFANLRLEAGQSNHLIFSSDYRPFRYLDDVAVIEEAKLGIVYYDLLSWLEQNPNQSLTFEMNGKTYRNQNAGTLADEIKKHLHSAWFRKWFHFQPVYLEHPEPCNV